MDSETPSEGKFLIELPVSNCVTSTTFLYSLQPDAYGQTFGQMSVPQSRSPSGPTYTQLGSTSASRGMWTQWGQTAHPDSLSVPVTSASSVHPQQPQELSDMLQILGQAEQGPSFEDLSMFNQYQE